MTFFRKSCLFTAFSILFVFACSDDDTKNSNEGPISEPPPVVQPPTPPTVSEDIELLNPDLIYDGYVLINDVGRNRVYLMDKNGAVKHEWPMGERQLGMDARLLNDGRLLISLKVANTLINFGGAAGKIQLLGKNGDALWDFDYSTADYITHHDAELLPNGNIMAMTWNRVPIEDANAIGSKFNKEIFTEGLIEINPETKEIVWQWNSLDHLIQDFDATKANFGDIAENPQLIDVNYVDFSVEAVMHSNGFVYDGQNDLIYMSVNNIGEVWVLDHSTTKEESALHTGGNFNKGGDLVYRFGNPQASKSLGDRWFSKNNHHPYLLDSGTMLIFSNGDLIDESIVLELELPEGLSMQQTPTEPPVISWNFMDPDLNAGKASGAVRLPNGNTLITENDFGVWEVTQNKEVVWKYTQPGFIWRSYGYNKDDAGILALQLD